MLFPADTDGWNLALITENLTGMLAALQVAGAQGVVITSVFDTRTVVDDVEKRVPGVAVTCCRLRADEEDHTDRFEARGYALDTLQRHLDEAAALDERQSDDVVVDGRA